MIRDRDQRIRKALERFRSGASVDGSYDHGLPSQPVGHALGLEIADQITLNFRETWRPLSMKITPQQVIETIVAGGVTNWVLIGLYGYVGYLSQPRATQDVDVMVARDQRDAVGKNGKRARADLAAKLGFLPDRSAGERQHGSTEAG